MGPSYTFPLTPEQIKARLPDRYLPTVITNRDQTIVAFANWYDWDANDASCWLGNVITAPQHRGTGAARYLVETMMTRAREELGCRRLRLFCHNPNTRALLFYSKMGFAPCRLERRADHKQNPIAAIEMEIQLRRESAGHENL